MLRIWYTELHYLDTMKSLCAMLNRVFELKYKPRWNHYSIVRAVEYGGWKYHYRESVWDTITYSMSFKSPMDMFKKIIERANASI